MGAAKTHFIKSHHIGHHNLKQNTAHPARCLREGSFPVCDGTWLKAIHLYVHRCTKTWVFFLPWWFLIVRCWIVAWSNTGVFISHVRALWRIFCIWALCWELGGPLQVCQELYDRQCPFRMTIDGPFWMSKKGYWLST